MQIDRRDRATPPHEDRWLAVERRSARDRITIRLAGAPRSWPWLIAIVAVAVVWNAVTALLIILAIRDPGGVVLLIAAGGVLSSPFFVLAVLHAFGREVVEIDPSGVRVRRRPGGPGSGWRCPAERFDRLSLEHWDSGMDEPESVASVNLVRRGGNPLTRRCLLGSALSLDARRRLHAVLVESIRRHGLAGDSGAR